MNGRAWTDVEIALLHERYPELPTSAIAAQLGREIATVYRKAFVLGLHKSESFMSSVTSGRIQRARTDPRMVQTQFRPGIEPWNKGIHYVAGGRSAETRFKKGHMPQTWLPVGSYRIVPGGSSKTTLMLERKTSETPGPNHLRWTPVSRLVWIETHGTVPDGHIVVFKPGRHTTVLELISPDALECITRAENARRNHPRSKSPELGRLIALKSAITRQVNRITREHAEGATP